MTDQVIENNNLNVSATDTLEAEQTIKIGRHCFSLEY